MSPDRFALALADFELERTAESVRSSRPEWVMGIGKLEWEKLYGGDVPLIVKTVDGLTEKKYRICSV